jgi:hypothetical protein
MDVTIKVGSRFSVPGAQGLVITSSDPTVIQVTGAAGKVIMDAKKPGTCTVSLTAGTDLQASLAVTVAA